MKTVTKKTFLLLSIVTIVAFIFIIHGVHYAYSNGLFESPMHSLLVMHTIQQTKQHAINPLPRPLIIGHRGNEKFAPENTLPSFTSAIAENVDMIELDYHTSKDGELIVIHDSGLSRTTDALEKWKTSDVEVKDKNVSELKTLDAGKWFSKEFEGTTLPTLTEALATIQPHATTIIENKSGSPEDLVALLGKLGYAHTVLVHSYDWNFIASLHRLDPNIFVGVLGPHGRKDLDAQYIEEIKNTGANFISWSSHVSKESIALAHENGLRVFIYTINEVGEAKRLVSLGADGIITGDPRTIVEGFK